MEWYWPTDAEVAASLPGYKPTTKGHPRKIKEAAELISQAERPVPTSAAASQGSSRRSLKELAELTNIPVVTTLMA